MEVVEPFKQYVIDYKELGDVQLILNKHENDSNYIRLILKYDDFLESSPLFYFAGYYYENTQNLKIISLQRANQRPLQGYHCEPFANIVVNRLKSENKGMNVSSWGYGGDRGFIRCDSINLKLKSYTDHWRIYVGNPDNILPGHKSLQQVFDKFGTFYSLTWSEDKSFLILPMFANKDLVETGESFVKELLS